MSDFPKRSLYSVYLMGAGLATVLFAVHTFILFETAHAIFRLAEPFRETLGLRVAGPLLVLGCFLMWFVTHLLEAVVWAVFFWRKRLVRSFAEGLYFTGTSLTALGYGDVVLTPPWRGLGPIMAT
ncbi:MAG TPA: ion channel, partial [Chthoniobacterales bacterium]